MFHKVKAVSACADLRLLVWFEGGEAREYDVRPLIDRFESFVALEYDNELFRRVRVVGEGYGIEWNDELDLACNELYFNGVEIDVVGAERVRITEEVRSARRSVPMSQTQLERASGVSQPVIARLERGDTAPQLDTLLKVLTPLGKTLRVVDLELP